MITTRQLDQLRGFNAPSAEVASLYLDLEDRRGHAAVWEALAAGLAREEPAAKDLAKDLRRIGDHVSGGFDPRGWRGLAVFSADRLGLWRACPLPQPVKNQLRFDRRPYLSPLLAIARQSERFGVAVVAPKRSRFLETYLGQIKEYGDLRAFVRADGAGPHAYLRDVAERLASLSRSHGFDRLVIGAPGELGPRLVERLRPSLREGLLLEPGLGLESPAGEILARVLAWEDEARKTKESELARRVLDLAAARTNGVAGLSNTLFALQQRRVRLLLVRDGFARLGRRCPGCGALSLADGRCAQCRRPTQTVFNLVEEMVQKALDLRCEVFRVFHDTALDFAGKIAAELSLAQAPQAKPC